MASISHPVSHFHRVPPADILGFGADSYKQCKGRPSHGLLGRTASCIFGREHAPFHGLGHKRADLRRS